MPLTGNTYGSRVARIGVPVLLALDFGGGAAVYDARILSITADGTPIIGRVGADPATSTEYTFASTSTAADVAAMTHGQWTWHIARREIVALVPSSGTGNITANEGDGWITVRSVAHTTVGGTSLSIQWAVTAAVTVGGKARVVIAGGAFGAGVQVGPELSFDALPSAPIATFAPQAIPVTASPGTEYTVSIQVQAVGTGASVVVNDASSPTTNGARIALVEYH